MKKGFVLSIVGVACVFVVGFCAGCNSGGVQPSAVKQADPTAAPQQGEGGVKAAHGGGMSTQPQPAKPGEKTGIPK